MNPYRLKARKYLTNYATAKYFSATRYKITLMRSCRNKGVEDDEERRHTPKGQAGNTSKLKNSLSRSRTKVFELAYCNPWEYFVTFTLDKDKYDRYALKPYIKDLTQFIRDYRKKHGVEVKYLLIPERHTDGAWHIHGFLMGLPEAHLRQFSPKDKLPVSILSRLRQGVPVFTWDAYANKFGYASIERVENNEAASKYITKYITEDLERTIGELNAHIYYSSKQLKKPVVVCGGHLVRPLDHPDYENDYVKIKTVRSGEEAFSYFYESE